MFDISKTVYLSEIAADRIAALRAEGHSLEQIVTACQSIVNNAHRYDLEAQVSAAGLLVVASHMFNEEHAKRAAAAITLN